ncbi:MAG: hypothetical protein Kow0079_06530 [Vicingaceae bacterium]
MKAIDKYKSADEDYKPQRDRSNYVITIMIILFFAGLGLVIGFYQNTLISIFELSKWWVLFSVIGFFIPLKWYQKKLQLINYEVVLLNILGFGPFLTGLFLTLNFLFAGAPKTQKIAIVEQQVVSDFGLSLKLQLVDNKYKDEEKITTLWNLEKTEIKPYRFLLLSTKKGGFGYTIITDKQLKE